MLRVAIHDVQRETGTPAAVAIAAGVVKDKGGPLPKPEIGMAPDTAGTAAAQRTRAESVKGHSPGGDSTCSKGARARDASARPVRIWC